MLSTDERERKEEMQPSFLTKKQCEQAIDKLREENASLRQELQLSRETEAEEKEELRVLKAVLGDGSDLAADGGEADLTVDEVRAAAAGEVLRYGQRLEEQTQRAVAAEEDARAAKEALSETASSLSSTRKELREAQEKIEQLQKEVASLRIKQGSRSMGGPSSEAPTPAARVALAKAAIAQRGGAEGGGVSVGAELAAPPAQHAQHRPPKRPLPVAGRGDEGSRKGCVFEALFSRVWDFRAFVLTGIGL